MYLLTSLVAFMFTINLSSCEGRTCLDGYLEGAHVRGRLQNKLKNVDEPMFALMIFADYVDRRREYEVYVSSRDPSKRIKTIMIMANGHPYCGEGQFTFNNSEFYQYKAHNCDIVFETKNHSISANSPILKWSPPYCNCVQFRVIVVSGDAYYTDDENVESGPLSHKVCINKQDIRYHYIRALCSVIESSSAINVIRSQYFLRRHNLDAKVMNETKMLETLQTRLAQFRDCCVSTLINSMIVDKEECMDDIRRRRIDNLCTNNVTDIPMADYKVVHTLDRQKQCCHLQGELKYTCFGKNGKIAGIINDTLLDFSNEDTDPVNDLAIFGSFQIGTLDKCLDKDREVFKHVTTVAFLQTTSVTDKYNDPFIRGSNLINTVASKMKKKTKAEKKQKKKCCKAGRDFQSSSSKTNRNTTMALDLIEYELGFKNYVGRKLISNFTVCEDKFVTCGLRKQCCKAGKEYSACITFNEITIVTDACKEGSNKYAKWETKKSYHQLCEKRFATCCLIEKTFTISSKNKSRISYL